MKLISIIQTKREVKAQRKVLSYLNSANTMWQSKDVETAISAVEYWLDNRVKSARLSR
jgi:hypothetical protein